MLDPKLFSPAQLSFELAFVALPVCVAPPAASTSHSYALVRRGPRVLALAAPLLPVPSLAASAPGVLALAAPPLPVPSLAASAPSVVAPLSADVFLCRLDRLDSWNSKFVMSLPGRRTRRTQTPNWSLLSLWVERGEYQAPRNQIVSSVVFSEDAPSRRFWKAIDLPPNLPDSDDTCDKAKEQRSASTAIQPICCGEMYLPGLLASGRRNLRSLLRSDCGIVGVGMERSRRRSDILGRG